MLLYVVYTDIQDMTGHGEEWLIGADGNPIAVFYDGNLRATPQSGNTEPTIEAA